MWYRKWAWPQKFRGAIAPLIFLQKPLSQNSGYAPGLRANTVKLINLAETVAGITSFISYFLHSAAVYYVMLDCASEKVAVTSVVSVCEVGSADYI